MFAKVSAGTLIPSKAVSEHMHVQADFTYLIAVAGSTVNATQKVCAMAAAFAPEAEAKQLQTDIKAGGPHSQQFSACNMMQSSPAQSNASVCGNRHSEHRRGFEGKAGVTHQAVLADRSSLQGWTCR